jgi:ATP-binding cassette subfamily A (ABC1) protein 3
MVSVLFIIKEKLLTGLLHIVTIAHFSISIVTPAGSLLRALLLTFNEFSLLCRGNERASYAGGITVYGGPILYLCIQSLFLLGFLVYYDSGYRPAFLSRKVRVHTSL